MIFPHDPDAGTIDWHNESHAAYKAAIKDGNWARAQVAAIMHFAECTESLRLLLLDGTANYGAIEPLNEKEVMG